MHAILLLLTSQSPGAHLIHIPSQKQLRIFPGTVLVQQTDTCGIFKSVPFLFGEQSSKLGKASAMLLGFTERLEEQLETPARSQD